jgi:hypothetical protein
MKINGSRFLLCLITVFGVMVLFDYVMHGVLLTPLYDKTTHLWRSEAEMLAYMPVSTLIQFVSGAFLTLLFIALNVGEGLWAGLRFGIFLGILMAFSQLAIYPYMTMPLSIAASWFIGTIVETILLCGLISVIYKQHSDV